MPTVSSRARTEEDGSRGKLVLLVVIVVLAIAAAVFSITRTVKKSQGENMGSLGGIPSKAEMMKESGVEPPAGGTGSGMEGPAGSGREAPRPGAGGKGTF